ncbi:MAG: transcriptional regulator YeiL [Oscillospiraceae bacterium]|jgi:CRP/FNR family putative post-exponential-phase nitrogen-starvation transcriptional regulator
MADALNRMTIESFFGFDISPYTSYFRFSPGDCIVREGVQPRYLYYLFSGRVKITTTLEDGRVSLNFSTAPSFIGELELLDPDRYPNGITALTWCECYAVDTVRCRDRILEDPVFLRNLCLMLSRKTIDNDRLHMESQGFRLRERLAEFILTASSNGIYSIRHTEASQFLGVSYRHLLYVMSDFIKRGYIKKIQGGYVIEDRAALEELSSRCHLI